MENKVCQGICLTDLLYLGMVYEFYAQTSSIFSFDESR